MHELLNTKLFRPMAPDDLVPRPRLVDQLNQGARRKLSLLTAPAGYGKTTLVTAWLHQLAELDADAGIVWLSLDGSDDDERHFFSYFVTAICQTDESFTATGDALLHDLRGEMPASSVLTTLLNRVADYERRIVLVLDDYHEITQETIQQALSFWLDHQPPNFHLVITSRAEPPLPLPRLRVRRQVTEINTEALRFTLDESADFLNHHMHLKLSAADIAQLDSMTEGWVASLQLAALSLQDNVDPASFIQTFKGDTTATLSTTWSAKSYSVSRNQSVIFYCRRRYWSGYPSNSATQ